jgi:hypothetical protein
VDDEICHAGLLLVLGPAGDDQYGR